MTVKFTVVGGNGLISNEPMGPIRRQTRGALVGHQQPSVATREALGSIRRQMRVEPVVHGYPVPTPGPTPTIRYLMWGVRGIFPVGPVTWIVSGAADMTGAEYSGGPGALLSYTIQVFAVLK